MKTIYNLHFNTSPTHTGQLKKIVYPSVFVETDDQATAAKLILQHIDRLETAIIAKEFANKGDFFITYEKAEKEIVEEFKITALCNYDRSVGTAEFSIYLNTPIEKMERDEVKVLRQVWEELQNIELEQEMLVSKIVKSHTLIQMLGDSEWAQTFETPTTYLELPSRVIEPLKFCGLPSVALEIWVKRNSSPAPVVKRHRLVGPVVCDYRLARRLADDIVGGYEQECSEVSRVTIKLPWNKNPVTLKHLHGDKLISSTDEYLRQLQE